MEKKGLLVLLLLLPFGCAGERSNVQNPIQLSYGAATQSNANMNYQPSVVIGNQPLGKEKFLAALLMDILDQNAQLSILEEWAMRELKLPKNDNFLGFPTPLNTSVFSAMRVAYPKEFLELDEHTRTSFMTFYRQLDKINYILGKRSDLIPSALSNASEHIKIYDARIVEAINTACDATKHLKRE